MAREDLETLAHSLHVNLEQNPRKYLGLNFKFRGEKVVDFQFLVDKLHTKLQGWKAKLLSQAGRTTLVSFMLQSIPLYTFSCFKVPEAICNKIDVISEAFLWGHELGVKKMHLLNWDKLCKPKKEGGVGLKKFSFMNQAMLAKQFWRISKKPQSLLVKTFKAKYFPRSTTHECTPKPH